MASRSAARSCPRFSGFLQLQFLALDGDGVLLEALLGQLDLQLLVLDLLGDGVELTVVAHVVLLLLVVGDHDLGLIGLALALLGQRIELVDLAVDLVDAGLHARHFILQVLYLQRQIALHLVDLVDLAVDPLQLVECQDLLLHRIVNLGGLLLCSHIMMSYNLVPNPIVHRIARALAPAERKGNQIFR